MSNDEVENWLIERFEEILFSVKSLSVKSAPLAVTGFMPMKGDAYDGELMIVGRAVNTWKEDIDTSTLDSEEVRKEYERSIYSQSMTKEKCPMSWVQEKRVEEDGRGTRRSAFWNATKNLLMRMYPSTAEQDIFSHIVWSNLYKIAPEAGGNPNAALKKKQFEACRKMLVEEIRQFRPKKILFMTGHYWADPFLENSIFDREYNATNNNIEYIGRLLYGNVRTDFVVAQHPQGRKIVGWVDDVEAAFEEIERLPE